MSKRMFRLRSEQGVEWDPREGMLTFVGPEEEEEELAKETERSQSASETTYC